VDGRPGKNNQPIEDIAINLKFKKVSTLSLSNSYDSKQPDSHQNVRQEVLERLDQIDSSGQKKGYDALQKRDLTEKAVEKDIEIRKKGMSNYVIISICYKEQDSLADPCSLF